MNIETTALYTGLLGLLFWALSARVMWWRFSTGVVVGDQDDPSKTGMIRAHANFFEYVPITLLMIALLELGEFASPWLHSLGAGLLVARLLHAVGMSRTPGVSLGRRVGTALTMVVMGVAALLCLGLAVDII